MAEGAAGLVEGAMAMVDFQPSGQLSDGCEIAQLSVVMYAASDVEESWW